MASAATFETRRIYEAKGTSGRLGAVSFGRTTATFISGSATARLCELPKVVGLIATAARLGRRGRIRTAKGLRLGRRPRRV